MIDCIVRVSYLFLNGFEGKQSIMSNQPVNHNVDATHLKNVFEQSLAMLDETKMEKTSAKHAARLRGNVVPIHVDPAMLQKRAIDDAARALASLWKIPGPNRLQGRTMQPNRKVS
jgi:hypothetical protein